MYQHLVKKNYSEDRDSGFAVNVVTWSIQGVSKVFLRGEVIQKFPYVEKMTSLFAKFALYGKHCRTARRNIYMRSSLDKVIMYFNEKKNIVTPYAWRLLNHPVVCVHEMEAAYSSVTLISLIQTTRQHS